MFEKDKHFQALPTFGMIPFFSPEVITHQNFLWKWDMPKGSFVGQHHLDILHFPLPTSGRLISTGRLVEVVDKGNAALVVTGYTTWDANTKTKLFYNEIVFYIPRAGGFSGQRQRLVQTSGSKTYKIPSRSPDYTVEIKISPEQAAIYRLTGDREGIHIDPNLSQKNGMKEPILHGACTLGLVGKQIFSIYGAHKAIMATFKGPVTPGDNLSVDLWKENDLILYSVKQTGAKKGAVADGYAQLLPVPAIKL